MKEGEIKTRTGNDSKDWARVRTTIPLCRENDFTSNSLVYVEWGGSGHTEK